MASQIWPAYLPQLGQQRLGWDVPAAAATEVLVHAEVHGLDGGHIWPPAPHLSIAPRRSIAQHRRSRLDPLLTQSGGDRVELPMSPQPRDALRPELPWRAGHA
jgi:hypothetical protein